MITLKSIFMLQLHFLRANMCLPYSFTTSLEDVKVRLKFSLLMQRASVLGVCICCCLSLTSIFDTLTNTKLCSIQNLIFLLIIISYRLGHIAILVHLVTNHRMLKRNTNCLLAVIDSQQTISPTAVMLYLLNILSALICIHVSFPILAIATRPIEWYKYPSSINRDFLYPLCVVYFNTALRISANFIRRQTEQIFFSTAIMSSVKTTKNRSLVHMKTRLRAMKTIQLDDWQTNSMTIGLELVERALNNLLNCFRLPITTMVATDMVEIVYSSANIASGNYNWWGSWPFLLASIVRISINLSSPALLNKEVRQVRETLRIIKRRVNQSSKLE
ncbi:Gustatory receptor 35, partial [Hyalella azteca]